MINSKIQYESNHTYILIEADIDRFINDYRYRMISDNRIGCIIPPLVKNVNNIRELSYDISNSESLLHYALSHEVGYAEIKALFEALMLASKELEKYLMEEDCLVISPELIFRDVVSGRYVFLCIPKEYRMPIDFDMVKGAEVSVMPQSENGNSFAGYSFAYDKKAGESVENNVINAQDTDIILLLKFFMNRVSTGDRTAVETVFHLYDIVSGAKTMYKTLYEVVLSHRNESETKTDRSTGTVYLNESQAGGSISESEKQKNKGKKERIKKLHFPIGLRETVCTMMLILFFICIGVFLYGKMIN